ncbi:MarR family winged helix-turn-helix transcriptional regulator [Herbiconiux sp. VKM Ac-2851]|uniref:MarR family winged helix-turn-helix transcriptional regulator n=1 Tax=Herbiconiux sp. VKM Ac-2851 TaxID=2739025 RepID=UPI001564A6E7|nr:MarR family winged helix-turn-helix transcriptional regulator [Herbiconiux sp. VKM Ac-2851]NQX35115.1 winged helix-turn-helix transcriptional regulator [Herbiconiux sp. VKM Ac-2851]
MDAAPEAGARDVAGVRDVVDEIREGWAELRPELDTSAVDVVGRVLRAAAVITRRGDELLAGSGLGRGEFDILAALRRAGEPRSPGALRTVSLATAPATTKRLQALEARGLVVRTPNPHDGRGALIALTPDGEQLIDDVFPQLLAVETQLVAGIPTAQLADVVAALRLTVESVEAA